MNAQMVENEVRAEGIDARDEEEQKDSEDCMIETNEEVMEAARDENENFKRLDEILKL